MSNRENPGPNQRFCPACNRNNTFFRAHCSGSATDMRVEFQCLLDGCGAVFARPLGWGEVE